jgi:hypothetical protein
MLRIIGLAVLIFFTVCSLVVFGYMAYLGLTEEKADDMLRRRYQEMRNRWRH